MNGTRKSTRAIVYARGVQEAIERQLLACREYASQQGLTIVAEVAEIKSAVEVQSSRTRQLFEQIGAHHPDVVLVTDLSRLSRKAAELSALRQALAECNVQIATLA